MFNNKSATFSPSSVILFEDDMENSLEYEHDGFWH